MIKIELPEYLFIHLCIITREYVRKLKTLDIVPSESKDLMKVLYDARPDLALTHGGDFLELHVSALVTKRHRELAYLALEGCDYAGASPDGKEWIDGRPVIGEYYLELAMAQALADIEAEALSRRLSVSVRHADIGEPHGVHCHYTAMVEGVEQAHFALSELARRLNNIA